MKRNHALLVIFAVTELLLASCQKMDEHLYGEVATVEIPIETSFKSICIYNNLSVNLKHSNNPRIELTCPSKLAGKISHEVVGDTLLLKNENGFNLNFSTNYQCEMTVYYDTLRAIDYASIGYLKCASNDSIRGYREPASVNDSIINDSIFTDTIVKPESFFLNINEGSGDIDLTFSCGLIKLFFNNGTSMVSIKGKAHYSEYYLRAYGQLDARNLKSNYVRINNASPNNAYVWAIKDAEPVGLIARIYNRGNIYYKGQPTITFEKHGVGRLIPLGNE